MYSGLKELQIADDVLKKYNLDIAKRLFKPLSKKSCLLDFGAGIGTFSILCRDLLGKTPDCCEIDPIMIEILRGKNFNVVESIEHLALKYDGIYSLNVLEHIEDDLLALDQIYKSLSNDGILCLYLPAFEILFSELDESVGHYRRYSKKMIIDKLNHVGFNVINFQYVDCLGFFASLMVKYFGYNKGLKLGSPKSFKIFDSYIYPISKYFDALLMSKLFGKNIMIVAKKSN